MNNANALQIITGDIYSARDSFEACLVDRSLNFEREAGFAIQILSRNDYSMKLAMEARQSVVDAVTNVAAIGLSLNPAMGLAYLVPRDKKICLDVSFKGLCELAILSGSVVFVQSRLVHAADTYIDNGPGLAPTHTYNAFSKDRGEIVGVSVVAKTASGDFLSETMTVEDINYIRDRSEAYKAVIAKKIKSCPWTTDWSEMARKTCIRRASKAWPKTDRFDKAVQFLNNENGEGFAPLHDVHTPQVLGFEVEAFIAEAREQKTEKDLTQVYARAMAAAAQAGDREGAKRFKDAALAHRAVLRNTVDMEHREAA